MDWFKRKDAGMFKDERVGQANKTKWVKRILFISFIILNFFWFIFYSRYFDIKQIEIGELNVLNRDAIIGEIDAFFALPKKMPWGNRNIFTFDEKNLKNYLMDKFFVDSVTVDKVYPNILRLNIKERQRSVVLVTKNSIYIIDDYGAITDRADPSTASSTINILTDPSPIESPKEVLILTSTTSTYTKGQEYVESRKVRQWLDLASRVREAGIWFKGLDIGSEPNSSTINILLKENISVLIELDDTVDLQIETLRQFLNTKPNLQEIHEYIDVRVPGKIYYK